MRNGEAPAAAAAGELAEELGFDVGAEQLVPAIQVLGDWDYRRERVHVFELRVTDEPAVRPDGREIVEARFVDQAALASFPLAPPAAHYAASLPSRGNP